MTSIIEPTNIFAIWAMLFAIVTIAFWIERRGGALGSFGPISLIVFGLIASNLGILPRSAPSYDVVTGYFVPVAIPLLLFGANLFQIWREARRLIAIFLIGAVGTVAGAFLAMAVVPFDALTGPFGGMFTATYIGGSVNFAAVAQMLEIDKTPMMAPALAANSIAATIYLAFLVAIPGIGLFVRFLQKTGKANKDSQGEAKRDNKAVATVPASMTPLSVSFALAISCVITLVSGWLAHLFGIGYTSLLFATAITVFIATAFPRIQTMVTGHYQLGSILIYTFFVLIGVSSDLSTLVEGGARLTIFAGIILAVHFVTIMSGARIFGFTLAETVTASNACALGPASAAAIAASRGWKPLISPAILLGVFGYFVANYLGFAIGKLY